MCAVGVLQSQPTSSLYLPRDLGLGMCLLPLEPEQLLWVDNNSNRNPS